VASPQSGLTVTHDGFAGVDGTHSGTGARSCGGCGKKARYAGNELARKLGWSPTKVSRMETGDAITSEVDTAIYAAFCGVGGENWNICWTSPGERRRLPAPVNAANASPTSCDR